jgi:hypothetical protein
MSKNVYDGEPAKGPLNNAKTSPSDIVVTNQPNDEAKLRKTLSDSLKVTGQSTYSRKGR